MVRECKGEFMLADRRYCYPLTMADAANPHPINSEARSSTCAPFSFTVFERIFKAFRLPAAMRTDNGVPFAYAIKMDAVSLPTHRYPFVRNGQIPGVDVVKASGHKWVVAAGAQKQPCVLGPITYGAQVL